MRVHAIFDGQYRDAVMQSAGLLATRGLGMVPLGAVELGDTVMVRFALYGIRPDQVEVTVDRQHLTIRADSQSKVIELSAPVQAGGAVALYRHGVLSLILPEAGQQNSASATDTVTAQSEQSFPASDAPAWPSRRY
jgi:HSP20 family molecular chaperone IbpA